MGLGLWTLLFTISSAFVYLEQARIVHAAISEPALRTAFFARIDLLVNVLGLALQVLLTGRALAFLGAGGSAAMLPLVTLAGAFLLAARPTVTTVQWFQVARRAVDYAIARPSREVFYTAVGRAELLGAKSLIDTAVYRAGDAAALGLRLARRRALRLRPRARRPGPAVGPLDTPQPRPRPRPETVPRRQRKGPRRRFTRASKPEQSKKLRLQASPVTLTLVGDSRARGSLPASADPSAR